MTIDLDTARAVLKADGDDDLVISRYLAGARGICEGYCNRKFYDTQEECDNDFLVALSNLQTVENAEYVALQTATGTARDAIVDRYIVKKAAITARINGIVADELIDAAILVTLAFLYFNREDAPQVPMRAQRILQSKLWIGDLADGPYVEFEPFVDEVDFDSLDFRYSSNSQYVPLILGGM